jgi:hypothetical protein
VFYQELLTTSEATEEEAWELVSGCIKKIFEDLRRVRATAANATSEINPSSKCATYLWALIQSHRIMKEYIDARFRNHPSIAPVIILHVFKTRVTQVSHNNNVKRLEGRIAKLESAGNKNPKGGPKAGRDADVDKNQARNWLPAITSSQGRKRLFEATEPAEYSAYGITFGKFETVSDLSSSCCVIVAGWPTWCIGLHLRCWNLKFVFHKDSQWASHISSWFPGAVVIDIRDIESTVMFNEVDHWFSDVEPPRKFGLWYTATKTITSLRRLRHIPAAGWKMEQHEITHLSTGGVTDGRWTLYHYVKEENHQVKIYH